MASQVVTAPDIFPNGTSVGAYGTGSFPSGSDAPVGSPVNTQVVASGSVTFTGLTDGTSYFAAGQVSGVWRRVGFRVDGPPHDPVFTDEATTFTGAVTFNGDVELPAGVVDEADLSFSIATQAELDAEASARAAADTAHEADTTSVHGITNTAEVVLRTLVDAKGDILAGTAADALARFAAGSNGAGLVADSSQASGLKWLGPEVINVKAPPYNAVGDGVADDTAAINAAITAAQALTYKTLYFPPGTYLVSAALTALTGDNWRIFGHGAASRIRGSHDGVIFTINVSSASAFYGEISDLEIRGPASGSFASAKGILVDASAASATGLRHWTFRNLRFAELLAGIDLEDTGKTAWGGYTSIAAHTIIFFENIRCLPIGAREMTYGIRFQGGSGPHNVVLGGNIHVNATTGIGVSVGSGAADVSVGDFMLNDLTVQQANVGADFVGPSPAGPYNQNVEITGCHFDNCTIATVRMTRMQNFRILPNNSTATVGLSLSNCSNYIIEDRNSLTATKKIVDPSGFSSVADAVTIADDAVKTITLSGTTRNGMLLLTGNFAGARSAVVFFRVGDGSGHCTIVTSSGGVVTGTTGVLTGTTGVDGALTISVNTASPIIYIENRTGASCDYTFSFLNLSPSTVTAGALT